jgi:hypothetical protein
MCRDIPSCFYQLKFKIDLDSVEISTSYIRIPSFGTFFALYKCITYTTNMIDTRFHVPNAEQLDPVSPDSERKITPGIMNFASESPCSFISLRRVAKTALPKPVGVSSERRTYAPGQPCGEVQRGECDEKART